MASKSTASLQFLSRNLLYEHQKPYAIQYTPHGDIPQTNIIQETVTEVPITNVRPFLQEYTLPKDGFMIRKLNSEMKYEEFANPQAVRTKYLQEIVDILKAELETPNVAILEYLVRRRHSTFPLSPGEDFEFAQPVPTAHIDFSPDCIREMLEDRYVDDVASILGSHYQIVNVWKPLSGPLRDWPLCLCHPESIDQNRDLQLVDRVYASNIEENIQVHYSIGQNWLFLQDQMPDELLIFRTGDSELGLKGGVPHCAFQLHSNQSNALLRESIEVRALVSYSTTNLEMDRKSVSKRHGPSSEALEGQGWHRGGETN